MRGTQRKSRWGKGNGERVKFRLSRQEASLIFEESLNETVDVCWAEGTVSMNVCTHIHSYFKLDCFVKYICYLNFFKGEG